MAGDHNSRRALYREDVAYIHHTGFGDFARRASPELIRLMRGAGIRTGTIVDLGCGSGLWARVAERNGFKIIGVDQSAAMVRRARRVVPQSRFVRASLYEFELPRCDAVTIIGEGLNYLSPGDHSSLQLHRLFARIAAALRPGGLLIFDVMVKEGQPMNYRKWWEGKDWAIMVEFKEKKLSRRLTRKIIAFRKTGTTWRRSQEEHRLRLFARAELLKELRNSKFSVRVAHAYGRFSLMPRRLAFIARKVGAPQLKRQPASQKRRSLQVQRSRV